jgi:ribonuclease D
VTEPATAEPPNAAAFLVTTEGDLRAAIDRLARATRIALDVESNGLFKYRARLCTLQLADADQGASGAPVCVVDTLVTPLSALGQLLGPRGPRKIVHDVAFDARILAEEGLELANVLDTSIAARMLGRTATGLASLLQSELGLAMDKKLQHHDWTERPLREPHLRYLAEDVRHLGALADKIGSELDGRGITDEVEEETRYRLAQAAAAASSDDHRPPWVRMKGIDRAPREDWPILRLLAQLREDAARQLDVPPYKVIGPDVLFAVARARPKTAAELGAVKGATNGQRARALGPAMIDAVRRGLAEEAVPDAERAMIERPRLPSSIAKARRAREARLMSWRKAEAKRRAVDEQVVLPGHCLKDLADLDDDASIDAVGAVPGIGAFRVARDGAALLATLAARGPTPPDADEDPS